MLAGRINTNWLVIDGGGGDGWKNQVWCKHDTLYIGSKTVGKNTGEGVIIGEGLMRSAVCMPSLKLVELRERERQRPACCAANQKFTEVNRG